MSGEGDREIEVQDTKKELPKGIVRDPRTGKLRLEEELEPKKPTIVDPSPQIITPSISETRASTTPLTLEERLAALEKAIRQSPETETTSELLDLNLELAKLRQSKGNEIKKALIRADIGYQSKPSQVEKFAGAALVVGALGLAAMEGKLTYDSVQLVMAALGDINLARESANVLNAWPTLQRVLADLTTGLGYAAQAGEHALKTGASLVGAHLFDRFRPAEKLRKIVTAPAHFANKFRHN